MDDIAALDIERFRSLFNHLLNAECRLELRDQHGTPYTDIKVNEDEPEPKQVIDWASVCYKTRRMSSQEGQSVWATSLVLGPEEKVFWLKLIVDKPFTKISAADEARLKLILVDVSHRLAEDYSNLTALAGMSKELGTRYEEINMVYALDDVWRNSHSYQEQEAYEKILSNSLDYMAVDRIALIIPDSDLCLHYTLQDGYEDTEEVLSCLKKAILPLITTVDNTLVLNRDELSETIEQEANIPYKIIVTGIADLNQNVSGIVVFLNRMQRPHYTNTDRRLCELLAREISKIFQSKRDPVTGLMNRKSFETKLDTLVKNPVSDTYHSLIYFDIDRFQIVNDNWGHAEGDRLLKQVAALIRSKLGKKVVMSRLGGDEFGIILENMPGVKAEAIAEQLRRGIQELYFVSHDQVFAVSCSFGVAEIDPDISDMIDVLSAADVACHLVKEKGKNAVRLYQPTDTELVAHHDQMYWASRIKSSLDENQFVIFGQAITPLTDAHGAPSHFEILVRLYDEHGKMISPGLFIPAAERYNLMPLLDRWVLNETLRVLRTENNQEDDKKVSVSINVSGQSLCDDSFLKYVTSTIARSEIDPARICLEITETSAVGNLDQALKFIETLRDMGCLFALDDFGSGMSSFGYLKHLPVDYLKIDGIFIKNIINDPVDKMMVKSIHFVAEAMGLKTIAEFVENEDILNAVKELGVNYGQGYGIDVPSSFTEKLIGLREKVTG